MWQCRQMNIQHVPKVWLYRTLSLYSFYFRSKMAAKLTAEGVQRIHKCYEVEGSQFEHLLRYLYWNKKTAVPQSRSGVLDRERCVWFDVVLSVPELWVADGHSAVQSLTHRESAQFWELLCRLVDQEPQSTRQGWEEYDAESGGRERAQNRQLKTSYKNEKIRMITEFWYPLTQQRRVNSVLMVEACFGTGITPVFRVCCTWTGAGGQVVKKKGNVH